MSILIDNIRDFIREFGTWIAVKLVTLLVAITLLTLWLGTVVLWVCLALIVLAVTATVLAKRGFIHHISGRKIK